MSTSILSSIRTALNAATSAAGNTVQSPDTTGLREHLTQVAIPGSFTAIFTGFISESLSHMIPWLIVSLAVILCDLAFGLRASLLTGEKVRFSSAMRRTMGKMVTYFSFVVMVCMISVATGTDNKIDIYACLLVCFIEGCSIMSNLLKPKGYSLDFAKAIGIFGKRVLKVEKEDIEDVITKNNKQ